VLAPEKSSVYPELMPETLRPVGPKTRMDQLVEHMRRYTTVDVLDLREGLRRAKPEGRLYQLTDTHWTDPGAFVGYRQIAEFLSARYPGFHPLERSDFVCRTVDSPGGDLARILGMSRWLREERLTLEPIGPRKAHPVPMTALMNRREYWPTRRPLIKECDQAPVGRVVVIRDSFFNQLEPFFSEHFRRTVYLWTQFDAEVIAEEKPDLVVEEIVERILNRDFARPR
jgi:hypothetical protein